MEKVGNNLTNQKYRVVCEQWQSHFLLQVFYLFIRNINIVL